MCSVESEVSSHLDLSIIRYSRVEEDCRILSKGLNIQPDSDVVLSITSSGDNVLNLLLERPKKIVAIDFSPAQNFILELKIAAIVHLNYEEYLQVLGEVKCDSDLREDVYRKLERHLPKDTQKFWRSLIQTLREGLSSSGRLQKYINCFIESFENCVSSEVLRKYFSAENISDQKATFDQLPLDDLKMIVRQMVTRQVDGRSDVQLKYVSTAVDDRVEMSWKHFCSIYQNVPVQDNFYQCLYVLGSRSVEDPVPQFCYPPYLTEEGFLKLKGLVGRIEIVTSSIEEYIQKTPTKFDKMNLSDIFEYMSKESSDEMFDKLSQKVATGGRIAYWNLYNDRQPTETSSLVVLSQLSQQLYLQDRIWFYKSFHIVEKA